MDPLRWGSCAQWSFKKKEEKYDRISIVYDLELGLFLAGKAHNKTLAATNHKKNRFYLLFTNEYFVPQQSYHLDITDCNKLQTCQVNGVLQQEAIFTVIKY